MNTHFIQVLGRGSFGTVYLCNGEDKKRLEAVKKIPKKAAPNSFEKRIAELLPAHPNIVGYFGSHEDELYNYLSFQYLQGCDLFTYMETRNFTPFSERRANKLFAQLFRAICHLHENNVAHLDLKLENLMLTGKDNLVLIDFGLSVILPSKEHLITNYSGSMDYVSSEIILQQPFSGFKADLYSCGVILFTMLFSGFPRTQEERYRILSDKTSKPLHFPLEASAEVKDLLTKLLEDDPKQRITIEGIAKHKWMRKKLWWKLM
jgi:serine/threonine protein kinase